MPAEDDLVAGLRAGDERCFVALVDRYGPSMLRVAGAYVSSRAVAEEVVQDTWLAVLRGLDRFEQRSSVRTWIFGILVNIAKTRGIRERRTVPFSSAFPADAGPTVDPARFHPDGEPPAHAWLAPPLAWDLPEAALLSHEARLCLRAALDDLPERQRAVVVLRDVQGFDTAEVCALLEISAGNQRVLLHRGRAALRAALAAYVRGVTG